MKELIKITEKDGRQAVSLKELYLYLGMDKSNWTRWYTKNITNNEFAIMDIDWVAFVSKTNGNDTMDFAVTIDFAKKIAMMAKTQKGEDARQYFIECEKQLKQQNQLPDFSNPAIAARAWADQFEQRQIAEARVKHLQPKADSFDTFIDAKGVQSFQKVAGVLGIGRNTMMKKLRLMSILTSSNIPYRRFIESGHFVVKESTVNDRNIATTYVTAKGIDYLRKKLNVKK